MEDQWKKPSKVEFELHKVKDNEKLKSPLTIVVRTSALSVISVTQGQSSDSEFPDDDTDENETLRKNCSIMDKDLQMSCEKPEAMLFVAVV
ncbi:hypothetical protein MTR_4g080040 [Medicago truncatula]|uniref:Uncharacterized protein n=1 Tax=Medicago truncatula TaxID=3880 RepID=G7JCM2_MEDTR|nr:hypothetical protein MTR_4g080040 [Medicago truncatula]